VALGTSGTGVELTEYLGTGQQLKSVEIAAYKPAGFGEQLVDAFKFEGVVVSALGTSGSLYETVNELSFDYAKFGHTRFEYTDKGTLLGDADVGFDFAVGTLGGDGGPGAGPTFKGQLDEGASTQALLDYYVHFDGIGGANEWLRLDSFSMGMQANEAGDGSFTGKVTANDVLLMLGSSKALVDLTEDLLTGQSIKSVEIEAYRAGQGQELADEYRFEDVLVSALQSVDAADNELSLQFGKFSHGHVAYDAKGASSWVSEGFDFTQNQAFNGPAPDADLF
jgi:type VI protein secretion system component Hcp